MLDHLTALQAMHFQDSLAFVRSVCIALIALGFTSPAMAEKGTLRGGTNALPPDFVDGATISARAMRAAVLTTAGLVLRARAARTAVTAATGATTVTAATGATTVTAATVPTLDLESFSIKSWND